MALRSKKHQLPISASVSFDSKIGGLSWSCGLKLVCGMVDNVFRFAFDKDGDLKTIPVLRMT